MSENKNGSEYPGGISYPTYSGADSPPNAPPPGETGQPAYEDRFPTYRSPYLSPDGYDPMDAVDTTVLKPSFRWWEKGWLGLCVIGNIALCVIMLFFRELMNETVDMGDAEPYFYAAAGMCLTMAMGAALLLSGRRIGFFIVLGGMALDWLSYYYLGPPEPMDIARSVLQLAILGDVAIKNWSRLRFKLLSVSTAVALTLFAGTACAGIIYTPIFAERLREMTTVELRDSRGEVVIDINDIEKAKAHTLIYNGAKSYTMRLVLTPEGMTKVTRKGSYNKWVLVVGDVSFTSEKNSEFSAKIDISVESKTEVIVLADKRPDEINAVVGFINDQLKARGGD